MTKVPNRDGTVDVWASHADFGLFSTETRLQALSRKKFMFEQLVRNIFQSYYGKQQTLTQFYYNNSNITKNEKIMYHFSFLWFILFVKPLNCYWAQKAFSKYIICALRKVTKDTSPSIISTLMMTHVFRPAGLHKGERLLGQLYWTSDPTNASLHGSGFRLEWLCVSSPVCSLN